MGLYGWLGAGYPPGSDKALDNAHGRGAGGMWWIGSDCKLHAGKDAPWGIPDFRGTTTRRPQMAELPEEKGLLQMKIWMDAHESRLQSALAAAGLPSQKHERSVWPKTAYGRVGEVCLRMLTITGPRLIASVEWPINLLERFRRLDDYTAVSNKGDLREAVGELRGAHERLRDDLGARIEYLTKLEEHLKGQA